jgi:hypothetical protein
MFRTIPTTTKPISEVWYGRPTREMIGRVWGDCSLKVRDCIGTVWIALHQFNFLSSGFENFVQITLVIWVHNRKALHRLSAMASQWLCSLYRSWRKKLEHWQGIGITQHGLRYTDEVNTSTNRIFWNLLLFQASWYNSKWENIINKMCGR